MAPALNREMFTLRVSTAVRRAEETVRVQVFLAHDRGGVKVPEPSARVPVVFSAH